MSTFSPGAKANFQGNVTYPSIRKYESVSPGANHGEKARGLPIRCDTQNRLSIIDKLDNNELSTIIDYFRYFIV